jgi:uridine kinase
MLKSRPILIGVVGGSGAGKSWLADKLRTVLGPSAARLSLDDFYLDRSHLSPARRARLNFDHPRAIDWEAFERILRALRNGRAAEVPCYDFATHCRTQRTNKVRARRVLIIDGLWLFRRPQIRKLFDLRIYVNCSARTRLRRRLQRDTTARGRTNKSVRAQFWATVEPMHSKYVAGQSTRAEVLISEACPEKEIKSLVTQVKTLLNQSARD